MKFVMHSMGSSFTCRIIIIQYTPVKRIKKGILKSSVTYSFDTKQLTRQFARIRFAKSYDDHLDFLNSQQLIWLKLRTS